jgi:hypothetical protein
MVQRLNWAKAHRSWTSDDWRRMIFSDETKINVWGSDGCKYFWRRPDDKLQFHHLDLTVVKHGGGSLMMWGCITYDGPGYACQIFDGTMKKEDYIHILETTLKDTMEWYGYDPKEVYFQQDKDPKHTAKATKQWFKDCCIPPTILHRHNSKESTVHLCHTRTLSDNPIRLTRPA